LFMMKILLGYRTLKLIACIVLMVNSTIAQIDTLRVYSEVMKKDIDNLVILPQNNVGFEGPFPVLYLLHGSGGNYTDWVSNTAAVQSYADAFNIMVVCPDGGNASWYLDSPIDPKIAYETYMTKELILAVDKRYNTISNKKGRGIAGLSMGGHGALYLALKHQYLFGAAGSMSGGLDLRAFPSNKNLILLLGNKKERPENWDKNSVINLVAQWQGELKLAIDCGVDDYFIDVNRKTHQQLLKLKIPHDYTERAGQHDWNFWANAFDYQMLFFHKFFIGG
jgi:S-formylglutathione hydrolase FrmB